VIGIFPDHGLTHPWAANVVDLCPVGALLSKDFLNKARAWELDRAASICPNCSQGCNAMIETRDNVVVRMRPRPNEAVNQFYMCDHGRLSYRWLNRPDRVELPHARRDGRASAVDWDVALEAAAAALRGRRAHVVASPMLSNEALFLLRQLVDAGGGSGVYRMPTGPEAPLAGVEDLALRADRAANGTGADLLGFTRTDDVLAGLGAGDVLVVADDDLEGVDAAALSRAAAVVVVGTTVPASLRGAVDAVLPIANVAEEEGSFTNLRGRVQRFLQAKAAPGLARPSWWVLGDLLALLGTGQGYFTAEAAFAALAAAHPAFAGLDYATLGLRGRTSPAFADEGAATAGAGA
jgi:NADH-quinone oxidoreductase subunit G